MEISLLLLTILLMLLINIFRNAFGQRGLQNKSDALMFNILISLFSLVVVLIFGKGFNLPSVYTQLLGILFGIATGLGMLFTTWAMACGPMSYTILIVSCAMLLPTFSGALFWNEPISLSQYAGVVLLILSLFCGMNPKHDKRITFKWALNSAGAFLCSGLVGVMQKIHQSSVHKDELSPFLFIAFAVSALFMFGLCCYYRLKEGLRITIFRRENRGRVWLLSLGIGICTGATNCLNLYLSGVLPSVLFFPVTNGSVIVLSALAAKLFFNEKMERNQIVGVVSGALGVALCGNITELLR